MQHLGGSGTPVLYIGRTFLNPLNAKLNSICHLLALLGAHHILHVSRIKVKNYVTNYVKNYYKIMLKIMLKIILKLC